MENGHGVLVVKEEEKQRSGISIFLGGGGIRESREKL